MKDFDNLTRQDLDSSKYRRAMRTTRAILGIMRDFIPQDRVCQRAMEDRLMQMAYETNVEFINVPPEWDELDKLQLEKAILEKKMLPIILPEGLDG